MSAANDRPEDDDKTAPGAPPGVTSGQPATPSVGPAAGPVSGEFAAIGVASPGDTSIASALRPRAVLGGHDALTPASSERVLARVADVMDALGPGSSEAQVLDAFAAALVELLPGRAIALRAEPPGSSASIRPLIAGTDPPGAPGERVSHVTLASPPRVEVPVLVDDATVAVISVAREASQTERAHDGAVATAVAPFLASALRTARAGSDASQQLARLQTQLVQADRLVTIGRYAAEVVHEFNNPLSAIVAYADLLAHRPAVDNADRARIERIGEAATRVQGLARRLLAYARATPEPPGDLSVCEVLDQAVVFCEHVVMQYGATVEREFDPSLPAVFGVRAELVQVFVNLITNACHAMATSEAARLVITAHERGGLVCVALEDNGHGIEARHLPHIFEPFFTTKAEPVGTGLGLSIVRYILESHGARWHVTSEPGRGTRFEIELPVGTR